MSELSKIVNDYFKDKDYTLDELANEIDNLKIDVVKNYLENSDEDKTFVIKRIGTIEQYSFDKIARSIKNAADGNKQQLNSSDVEILKKDVEKSMKERERKVFRTDEIKEFVKNALVGEGYSKIYDSYVSYVQNQRN